MARFVYRLQKVFELRERKKKAQEQRVVEAQKVVRQVETAIEEKRNELNTVRKHMLSAPHTMMAVHDEYMHMLNQKIEILHQDLTAAKNALEEERRLLIKAQADLEALIKHREKMQEEWREEEKRLELKQLDEVAGQRYFRARQEILLDEADESFDFVELNDEDNPEPERTFSYED